MPEKNEFTTLERIEYMRGFLDKLADAHGREKCGYVALIDDFLNHVQEDVLIMEDKLKNSVDLSKCSIGIGIEPVQNGTEDSEPLSPE